MQLRWRGHACFEITHDGYTVVIDPYNSKYVPGYPVLKVKADKLLVSHEHYGHNYREGVLLSGKPERSCPFSITSFEADHDSVGGIMRGTCRVHILEADGIKVAHMSDIGTKLTGNELGMLFGADAIMVTAGSCTGLPSQEVWRLCDELFPKAVVPMHYRFDRHGTRRLERVEDLAKYYEAPEMIHYYDTNTIQIDENTEPQVAVLEYLE